MSETTMPAEKQAELRKAFPKASIGKLPRKSNNGGTIYLDYVGHAAVTDRLLAVDPDWSWEPVAYDEQGLPAFDKHGGLWLRLTICGVTRLGYGDAGNKSGPNAVKEAIGDGLRNAAMRFGVALDLWAKEDLTEFDSKAPESAPKARKTTPKGTNTPKAPAEASEASQRPSEQPFGEQELIDFLNKPIPTDDGVEGIHKHLAELQSHMFSAGHWGQATVINSIKKRREETALDVDSPSEMYEVATEFVEKAKQKVVAG